MTDHTPTPWIADPDDRDGMEWNVHIVEAARPHMRVCFMTSGPEAEGNAEFIVRACNSHDLLVAALDKMVLMYVALVESGDAGFWDAEKVPEIIVARAALTSAGARP